MKKFVQISSEITIEVNAGIFCIDTTNYNSMRQNRLSVQPIGLDRKILIEKGIHCYPAEITEWDSVKNLAKDRVISIGDFSDVCPDQDKVQAEADRLHAAKVRMEEQINSQKKIREAEEAHRVENPSKN